MIGNQRPGPSPSTEPAPKRPKYCDNCGYERWQHGKESGQCMSGESRWSHWTDVVIPASTEPAPKPDDFDECATCHHYRGEHNESVGCDCDILDTAGEWYSCGCTGFVEPVGAVPVPVSVTPHPETLYACTCGKHRVEPCTWSVPCKCECHGVSGAEGSPSEAERLASEHDTNARIYRAQWNPDITFPSQELRIKYAEFHECTAALLRSQARELEEAKCPEVCSVCAGTGVPVSGPGCICGGTGTEHAEAHGLRVALFVANKSVAELSRQLEEAKHDLAQATEAYKALSEGKPLGPIVGAQTIVNQQLEMNRLRTQLEEAKETKDAAVQNRVHWMAAAKRLDDEVATLRLRDLEHMARLEEARTENERLRNGLNVHSQHAATCIRHMFPDKACDCGLSGLLEVSG